MLDRLAAADPRFHATLTMGLVREPFEVADNAPIGLALRTPAGTCGVRRRKAGWADTALLAATGVTSAYVGPAGGGAHAVEEWLDLDSLETFTHILARTAHRFGDRASGCA